MKTTDLNTLLAWYKVNHRDLPWRKNRDPYRIWISETMLQQTTTTAVLNYYERFIKKFPTLDALANSKIEEVYAVWSGLGYYSRARNLLAAAQKLNKMKFPQTYKELLPLPGFGPYTARAVSSIAFSEPVGVLDGNVIRVLTRKNNLAIEWWKTKNREHLQTVVDQFVAIDATQKNSHLINQSLMELGSQICTPKTPHCALCPWLNSCEAKKRGTIALRPLKKPKREQEVWVWSPLVIQNKKQAVLMALNDYAPFLKQSWILPGSVKKLTQKPKKYDFRHTITHHDIFVQINKNADKINSILTKLNSQPRWVLQDEIEQVAPASLIKKVMERV